MHSEDIKRLDNRVIYGILGSKSFLGHIYDSFLDEEEKHFMSSVLTGIIENENKAINTNLSSYNSLNIDKKKCTDANSYHLKKIDFINKMIGTLGLKNYTLSDDGVKK